MCLRRLVTSRYDLNYLNSASCSHLFHSPLDVY